MIDRFVASWEKNKSNVRAKFAAGHQKEYKDVVAIVVAMLNESIDTYEKPDPNRIHQIDDGDCQGTLVFVIASTGSQPSTYWYVKISYGSCSGCDTLQDIHRYSGEPPTEPQLDQYMTLALHIVQGLKEMGVDYV